MLEPYQQLEQEFGRWAGVENVVACASGTAALHLALEALQLPPGSEVLVPDYTMVACPRAVVMAGLIPVFVDCGDDLLMDPTLLAKGLSHETRVIMPVHVYGRRCDMESIATLADTAELHVVEDLAEAHGVNPHPCTIAACYSFFRNKIIAGEEGGAVAFSCPDAAQRARGLRCLGFTADHDYTHTPRGWNHRLSNAHARLILHSLESADANIVRRHHIAGWYDRYCPDVWRMPRRTANWVYDLRIRGMTAGQQTRVIKTLQNAGIAARHGFKPMSQQLEFRDCRVIGNGHAARLASEVIYLPIQPGTTTDATARQAFALIEQSL